jgi:hypothetical protein
MRGGSGRCTCPKARAGDGGMEVGHTKEEALSKWNVPRYKPVMARG